MTHVSMDMWSFRQILLTRLRPVSVAAAANNPPTPVVSLTAHALSLARSHSRSSGDWLSRRVLCSLSPFLHDKWVPPMVETTPSPFFLFLRSFPLFSLLFSSLQRTARRPKSNFLLLQLEKDVEMWQICVQATTTWNDSLADGFSGLLRLLEARRLGR